MMDGMRLRLLIMTVLCLCAATASAVPIWGEPLVESIDDQDSIPDDNVAALLEDAEGFLWIGTPNGLLRYDGYRFQRFVHDPADPGSVCGGFVRALLLGADGRMWLGTNAEGVCVYDPRRNRFERLRDADGKLLALPDPAVRSLARTADGSIWIGTLGGLARWQPATNSLQSFPSGVGSAGTRDGRILELAVDRDDTLWVGSWTGVERRAAGSDEFVPVPLAPTLGVAQEPSVRAIVPAADGAVWFGTLDAAIIRRSPDGNTLERAEVEEDNGERRPSSLMMLAGIQTGDQSLWLSGLGGVLACEADRALCRQPLLYDPTVPSGLASQDIRTMLLDRAGQIWIGGYSSGLQRVNADNRALRMLRYRPLDPRALSDASISAVHAGADGRLYIGTRGRGIDVLDPSRGVIDRIRPDPDAGDTLANGVVTAIVRTDGGALWAGTDYGLARVDYPGHHGRLLLRDDGLPSTTIRRLALDDRGRLWIGTNLGLARLGDPDGRPQILLDTAGQAPEVDVNALQPTVDGGLWVGTVRGLFHVDAAGERMQRIDDRAIVGARLASPTILGLLLDRQQRLWLDTPNGLYRLREWDGERSAFEFVSGPLGIAGQPFGANLLEDAEGRIWSHHFVYDPARGRADELLRTDGADLGTGWFRSYDRDADGRFYFGGSKGLLRVEPALYRPWRYQPPTVISALSIDGQPQPVPAPGQPLPLDSGVRRLSVEFATLDYSAPQRLRYRYRLDGLDNDWIASDATRRVASYDNLWPGDYTLRIQGSNRGGDWSAELQLPITVAARFWQTPAFQVALGLSVLAAGWGGVRLYGLRLRRRSQQLQRLVDERTVELLQAKNSAERVADELREAQQQLVAQEKVAALGRLVAGVAHEINTPLGVAITASSLIGAQIRGLAEQVAAGRVTRSGLQQLCEEGREASALAESALARTAQLVQTFKSVAVDGDLQRASSFDLRDFLQGLFDSLQPGWRTAGVEGRLDCPLGVTLHSLSSVLGQVLMTLAGNALTHAFEGREGGHLTLTVTPAGEDGVCIEFADDGRGIAPEALPRVFEPFYTTRRARGGTGLGLHIVHNQVTARLGGSITVESVVGQGTRFILRLPRRVPEAS